MPKSAFFSTTFWAKSPKCSLRGSGLCGKCPVGSQYNGKQFTPKASSKAGIAIPPVEFTPSTTAEKPAAFIAGKSISGCARTALMC